MRARVLEEFPRDSLGSYECRVILDEWFNRASKAFGKDISRYNEEIWDASVILRGLRDKMSLDKRDSRAFISEEMRLTGRLQARLWLRPDNPLYTGASIVGVDRISDLEKPLTEYLNKRSLQSDLIYASIINYLLFWKLANLSYQIRSGEITGRINWGAVLGEGNFLAEIGLNIAFSAIQFFLRWLMLPLFAWALAFYGYEQQAIIPLGLWAFYLLFRLIRTPARWRKRKAAQKTMEEANKYFDALYKAWSASCGPMINPGRLRELILKVEEYGLVLPPILYTIIDRAIQRDPTALLTELT